MATGAEKNNFFNGQLYKSDIWMSHWRQQMVDGADFWISCHWLAFLSSLSQWQLIQKLVPSTICCHQYDIGIRRNFEKWKKSARRCQHHKIKNPILKHLYLQYLSPVQGWFEQCELQKSQCVDPERHLLHYFIIPTQWFHDTDW